MANSTEAKSRIKINKLLVESGWRFEDNENGKANIQLEPKVNFSKLGDDFENETHGFIDFLLLDKDGRSLVVVEAKRESIDPLSAKEQARNYARNKGARFVILSNGNIHYLWDTEYGNPYTISRFPTQESITQYKTYKPNPQELAQMEIDENYIAESQLPEFLKDPTLKNESTRADFLKKNNIKLLRPYQVQAIKALQESAKNNNQRFLFEMATGTGKTLVSAAVIKLFLQSGNAHRVLFLVDRLELENQAQKSFVEYLGKDFSSVIFKDNRDSWQNANIVVSTIQTLLFGDKYKKIFSPTDFEFVISDEAHRSIGGDSRAVFEYFVGYKLGLTATPKNYLKGEILDSADNQREYERRLLLDTYKTFGCESGNPTFSYCLIKGAEEGYLIQPIVVDARTAITTQLLSKEGYAVHTITDNGESVNEVFHERDYERKLFNTETNIAMCKAFLDNGIFDPVTLKCNVSLFGKSIVFCISQSHAARVTNILNKLAFEKWPEQFGESDFAMQVTSQVQNAQQMTINFSNNRLGGQTKYPEGYETSKTRVVVTVGMMTTGYDCQDLLNIALMRPVFSPSDFVQMKGRGTRRWPFEYKNDANNKTITIAKDRFKFFDFFASCEYFEHEFPYDEKIKLPQIKKVFQDETLLDAKSNHDEFVDENGSKIFNGPIDIRRPDNLASLSETVIDQDGMRIDRQGFKLAVAEDVLGNEELKNLWKNGDVEAAEDFTKKAIFDKPKHFLTLDKIRKIFNVDRRITVKEFLQVAFGDKETFEMKDELLEAEWKKFVNIYKVDQDYYIPTKNFFKAYIEDEEVRDIIKSNQPAKFFHCSSFDFENYQKLDIYKKIVPRYIHDYAQHLTSL
ncbi:MAG: DEAD/DEAH box helicase family protein [Candidatus Babeliales bacterium]|nr:DEAD/DEAH box helicase family protein [Candidatus Babeliales bacterium]